MLFQTLIKCFQYIIDPHAVAGIYIYISDALEILSKILTDTGAGCSGNSTWRSPQHPQQSRCMQTIKFLTYLKWFKILSKIFSYWRS